MKKQPESADIPRDWKLIDSLQETRRIADCTLYLRGYACQRSLDQKVVTGSWAGWEEPSLDKARLELQERLALMQALDHAPSKIWPLIHPIRGEKIGFTSGARLFPQSADPTQTQFARSNGVALGVNVCDAAQRAACEWIERHMILGSWYGSLRPRACSMTLPPALDGLQGLYRLKSYDFGSFELKGYGTVSVRGTFLWPLRDDHPVVYGFGAALDEKDALEKSLGEAVQRLAFLSPWEVPSDEPDFSPTPDFHQDYFLHPDRRAMLESWLGASSDHPRYAVNICRSGEAHAVDLTPPGHTAGSVVRVMISGTLPLVFGRFQPPAFPDLPERFWVHPIV